MNANQNQIITSLAQAIEWASTAMWEDHICLYDKENILENTERAKNSIQLALKALEEYEELIKSK